jgi:hypothetical protein
VAFEQRLDAGTLMPAAAAVNQADFAQPRGVCGGEVFVDERRDIRGREVVQIENGFNRELDDFRIIYRVVFRIVPVHGQRFTVSDPWSARRLRVGRLHQGFDAAAGREIARDRHALRGAHGD